MKIKYNENEDYCIYFGGLQSGKSLIFKSINSDSIHFNKKLRSNIINVFSYTSIYQRENIIGLWGYVNAIKDKLDNVILMKNDNTIATLKHINDVIKERGNPLVFKQIDSIVDEVLRSHYFTLKTLNDVGVSYKEKDILSLPTGSVDVNELFKEEIERYNIKVTNPIIEKMDYEWTYDQYSDAIGRNLKDIYDINIKIDLSYLPDYITSQEIKVQKMYGLL